jgi:hypothetical protein
MDISGLCSGHKMSKEEFLRRYYGGVEPETKTNEKGQTKNDKEVQYL